MSGLKIWTFCRAIWARRTRRMSSSLLPLNMLPVMTSIEPGRAGGGAGKLPPLPVDALDVGPGRRVDADDVALVDEGGHLHDEARLHLRRLADVRDRGALDGGLRLHDLHLDGEGQLDADR